jgi:translation initiation factor 5
MTDNKLINIPSKVQDVNYRYKMPKMILKIEGKGNGIKTNITNLVDVAEALRLDPECMENG